ncbi:hypothetical protein MPTK1_2g06350 [Marchantia polymorpha subsp. ruderalis]|uniref:Uncharacterized protein n=1 Tax=Marchantia polymorpha TaxID=3197 RepID=A0A2R6XDQ4_MARPO|nr:hypothetical protein MARPO_0021s0090 [Marchantia polymorpha]BBN01307.1 hypothetical protein Mp_2g06350 [Marchantia polymorpha subsp. ruderalis]|eukprot:PTQ44232.1 hypothetical protein MARPO_0021s0090 [Marchantia polymorpha]
MPNDAVLPKLLSDRNEDRLHLSCEYHSGLYCICAFLSGLHNLSIAFSGISSIKDCVHHADYESRFWTVCGLFLHSLHVGQHMLIMFPHCCWWDEEDGVFHHSVSSFNELPKCLPPESRVGQKFLRFRRCSLTGMKEYLSWISHIWRVKVICEYYLCFAPLNLHIFLLVSQKVLPTFQ